MFMRISALAVALFCSILHAEVSMNVGGGLNMSSSNSKAEEGVELSSRFGFNLGVGVDFFVNEMFAVSPGISIESRGETSEFSFEDDIFGSYTGEGSANFLYLQIPVLAKVQFPVGPAFLQLIAGPEIGFPLSKEVEFKVTSDGETETIKDDSELSAIDLGLTLGAGFKYPLGAVGLFVEPSYYLGLTNSNDAKDDPETAVDEAGDEVMHRNFKIKVGIYKDL
jgi:Outer membrane protein beta-barrel domain